MAEAVRHVTLNTGHVSLTSADDVDKGLYFKLRSIVDEAQGADGASLLDGTALKIDRTEYGYLCTLWDVSGNGKVPIVTSGGAKSQSHGWEIWSMMHRLDVGEEIGTLKTDIKQMPKAPFIADRLWAGATRRPDVLEWTGDLCRCVGLMMLFPEDLIKIIKTEEA